MLSDVLKQLRSERGITQEQLASEIGVERSSIGKYESSKKPIIPSSDVLIRIANYFDVSIDFLLENNGAKKTDSPESEPAPKSDSDDMLQKINASLPKLDRDSLLRVLGYVESLSNQHDSKKK